MTQRLPVPLRSLLASIFLVSCGSSSNPPEEGASPVATTPLSAPVTFDAVYVVNGEEGSISVINAENNSVAGTISLRGVEYPHHIALSPDRSLLGVAVPGYDMSAGEYGHAMHSARKGRVMVLDATGALRGSTPTNAANNNVAFTVDGKHVLTSQATMPGSTLVLDIQSLAVLTSISVGTSPAETVLSKDGATAYVANSDASSVSVVDVLGQRVRTTVKVDVGPVLAVPSGDGLLYVENEPAKTVSIIDATTFTVLRTIPLTFKPGSIAAIAGELWITAPALGAVEIHDRMGDLRDTITTQPGAHWVVFSADNTRAYISNQDSNSVSVVDRASKKVTTTIAVGAKPNGMVWRSR